MKYFLVVRNKQKQNLKVLEAKDMGDAEGQKAELIKGGHKGEIVIAYGRDMKSFLSAFTEYRPKNWRDLVK